ncbi:glycosyltransferase [Fulvivirga sp.]|uniref:glycosyltransferase n=1 Tax=Fulvivirga sp. TaxID=1931237 RepID=UPI0032EB2AFC
MISGRDIVIIGIQPWDIPIGSNCKNIAQEFAKSNKVLYVNEPLNRLTSYRNRKEDWVRRRKRLKKDKIGNLQKVGDNIWTLYPLNMIESINWMPESPVYSAFNKRNNSIFYSEIKQALNHLGFNEVILFNDSLISLGLYSKEMLRPSLAIYYIRDNLISQPYFAKHGIKAEPEIAGKYDAVVANSDFLANYLKKYNTVSVMVGQGCDLSLFNANEVSSFPEDTANLPKPIVGYVGFLTSMRLDLEILENVAQSMKKGSLVLVGPEDEDFRKSELHTLDNVYFLGNKDASQLPAYIASFDVCINPQVVNDMTVGNYPRKIDEYLAMGKPVVATYTEAMDYFNEHVYLSHSTDEFTKLTDKAFEENSVEKSKSRIEFAKSHTWENNVKNIYEVMEYAMTQIKANESSLG